MVICEEQRPEGMSNKLSIQADLISTKEKNTYELELERDCDLEELELRERDQLPFLFFLSDFGHVSSARSFLFFSSKK